jgi:NAD+ synthetase
MAKKPLRITLAQLNYRICDFARNLGRITDAVQSAAAADLIVFSELCLSGYSPQDRVEEPDFLARQDAALAAVCALSKSTRAALVIGAVSVNAGVGKPLHNSLLLVQDGRVRLRYHKQLLPTYNIFDERRHFEPGEAHAAVLELAGYRVGFLICEDAWNDENRDYPANPLRDVAAAGVDLVVSINASPSNVGKTAERQRILSAAATRHGVPMVYVNQVGGNDEIVFDGGSLLVDPRLGVVHRLPLFAEAVETVGFTGGRGEARAGVFLAEGKRCTTRVSTEQSDMDFYYRQIVLGLRDYVDKTGFHGVVIGASGGIDSALTLALATDALGAERVRALTMPSRYSSTGSVDDSATLCANLGVPLFRHDIGTLFDAYRSGFSAALGVEPSALTQENVQARIRGAILMEFSNHFGHLVLSTGNKSEISVGYTTLYGDMNGGLNLIGDLYKTEVFALARHYNQRHAAERIPRAILDKEPSAELAPGQRDGDTLPPYPVLDEILKLHIEGRRLRPEEFSRAQAFVAGLEAAGQQELLRRVTGMVARSEFKRRQAPPIIRLRGRAFGNGRQMPIAAQG